MASTIHKSHSKLAPPPPPPEGNDVNATKKYSVVVTLQLPATSFSDDEKILGKYKILQRLGRGAYGIVWESLELKSGGHKVALKKMFDAFGNNADAQRTYREIFFLLQFGHHPKIISLANGHRVENDLDFYIAFPLMLTSLGKVLVNSPWMIGRLEIRSIFYQVSKAILYLHSAEVIHRDIKVNSTVTSKFRLAKLQSLISNSHSKQPANILLDKGMDVKLGDFGLARSLDVIHSGGEGDGHPEMTGYAGTRWYRAPGEYNSHEAFRQLTTEFPFAFLCISPGIRWKRDPPDDKIAVDIWALACVLGEMAKKQAIFPARNTLEQVEMVLGTIEVPSWTELADLTCGSMRYVAQAAIKSRKPPIRQVLLGQEPHVIDLMERILVFNPKKRPTIQQPIPYSDGIAALQRQSDHTVTPPIDDNVCFSLWKHRSSLYQMLKNGEFPRPDSVFQESMHSGAKQEKIGTKNEVGGLVLPSRNPGLSETGGSGDASRTVYHDTFHSFPNPPRSSLNPVQLQEKSLDEPPEEKFLREFIKSVTSVHMTCPALMSSDSRGPFLKPDLTRLNPAEYLGTAPRMMLLVKGPAVIHQFPTLNREEECDDQQLPAQLRPHLSIQNLNQSHRP